MSKKHFEAIAAAFKKSQPWSHGVPSTDAVGVQWGYDVKAIADVLAGSNARFDRDRFYRACGVEVK